METEGISRARLRGFAAVSLVAFILLACAANSGGLSDREMAAAKAWKPTRWMEGKGTALVIMDMQTANMPIIDQQKIFTNIRLLVAAAEAAGCPVVWVYDNDEGSRPGESGFELAAPLAAAPGHLRVVKTGTTAFSGNDLEALLEARGIGEIVFAGVYSDECVRNSVAAAYYSGWLTTVAKDAHSIPVRAERPDAIRAMNARWTADRRVRLTSSVSIRFTSPR